MNYHLLLDVAADLGQRLAANGAETFRVEESVNRILNAYNIPSEVFAIPNCLIISMEDPDGQTITQMRRISCVSTNMDGIERYNSLSRQICATTPTPEQFKNLLEETDRSKVTYNFPIYLLGNILTGVGFAVFFGGGFAEALCSGFCGFLIGLINYFLNKLRVNTFFSTILASFVMSFVAYVLNGLGFVPNVDATIIGALMLLVPGMLFTNAMRDIIFGDTNSGVNRIVQVLLIAVAIALGTGCAWNLASLFTDINSYTTVNITPWMQCISALVACTGYGLVFNVHGRGFILCVLGGALGWGVYCIAMHFGCSEPLSYFFASIFTSLYSEVMARIRKHPATAFLVVSLMPMFPGAGVYYATRFFVQNDLTGFANRGSATIAIAGAIAIGILSVSTLFRLYSNHKLQTK